MLVDELRKDVTRRDRVAAEVEMRPRLERNLRHALRRQAPEHDQAQPLGGRTRCHGRRHQIHAVRDDVDAGGREPWLEPHERLRDPRRRRRDLDAPFEHAVDEERAHRLPFLIRLGDEDAVERIGARALAQVLERAAHARAVELRVDRAADRVQVMAHDDGLARHRERVERMPDER